MIGQDLRYKKRFVPPHRPIERRYPFLEGKRTHGDHRRRGTTVFAAGPRPELPTKRIRGSILLAWTSKLERTCVHAREMHLTCFCFFFLRHSCPRFTRPRPFFFPSLLHLSLLPPIGSTLLPPSCQLILLVLLLLSLSRTCIPLCVCELFFFFFFSSLPTTLFGLCTVYFRSGVRFSPSLFFFSSAPWSVMALKRSTNGQVMELMQN